MTGAKEPKSGYAEVEGVRLYYETAGHGPDLVFVHAGCADRRMWDEQFLRFAQHYRVLRYDMRGYGNSTLTTGPFSNRQDLYRLLEFLDISNAHMVACSIGSQTALDFALEHPQHIASLTLVSPAVSGYPYEGPPPQPVLELIAARQSGDLEQAAEIQAQIWANGFKRSADQTNVAVNELVRQMSLDALKNQREAIKNTGFLMEEPLRSPAIDRLEKIAFPTLTIAGDLDDDTVLAIADLLATRIRGAQKVVMHGTAHLPNMEKPEKFNQIILEFLRQI
jgi:2-hydroxy-6-oxonona-2,4-dienedioate hydrolase